ncbi:MAG: FtsH protease activity modulator HflK [Alphaproteobacteria bacterium]|nr:FtsH protease activity modulator HflK [Alphaproteobacteria bacterium]
MPSDNRENFSRENFHDMIILANQGPWGTHGGGDDGDDGGDDNGHGGGHGGGNEPPWTPPPRRRGPANQPPDLDEMLRQAQNRFRNTFGGPVHHGGGNAPGRMVGFLLLLVLVLWLGSGFYLVQPQENAALLTFGKLTAVRKDPGLAYHLPFPIQDVEKRDVKKNNQMDIGTIQGTGADNPNQSLMLATDENGDPNIAKVHFVIYWHIGDLGKYLFEIGDPEGTLQKVAESAMREVVGRSDIDKAMTEGYDQIQSETKILIQKILDEYQSGIAIDSIKLQSITPPDPVMQAFNDVSSAKSDKERLKREAMAYANNILPEAKGKAAQISAEAKAYKEATIKKAQGDADRFNLVYQAYAKSKDVTTERMYLDAMEAVLKNNRKVIMTGKPGGSMPLLPLMQIAPAAGGALDAPSGGDDDNGTVGVSVMPPQPGQ